METEIVRFVAKFTIHGCCVQINDYDEDGLPGSLAARTVVDGLSRTSVDVQCP